MDTAIFVAVIGGAVGLLSAAFTGWTHLHTSNRQRRSEAKATLDHYRGPLLDAACRSTRYRGLIYHVYHHRKRGDRRKGFTETDRAASLAVAHQQLVN